MASLADLPSCAVGLTFIGGRHCGPLSPLSLCVRVLKHFEHSLRVCRPQSPTQHAPRLIWHARVPMRPSPARRPCACWGAVRWRRYCVCLTMTRCQRALLHRTDPHFSGGDSCYECDQHSVRCKVSTRRVMDRTDYSPTMSDGHSRGTALPCSCYSGHALLVG